MSEKLDGGLSAAEESYFETGGETALDTPETTVAETVTPETVAEVKTEEVKTEEVKTDENKDRDEKGRFVPHGALHAEREEHKKTRAELDDLKRFRTQMEERFRLAEEAKKQAEDPFAQEPDPNEAPIDWINWRREMDRRDREVREKETAETKAARERTELVQQHFDYVQRNFLEEAKADPDLEEAYRAATQSLDKELEAFGYRGRQLDEARKQSFENFVFHASNAIQNGMTVGQFVKGLAASRGWQKQAPAVQQQTQQEVKLPEQLAKVAEAQAASRTVGQGSGRAGGEELGLEDIAALSPQDFSKWYADEKNAARFDKMLGSR